MVNCVLTRTVVSALICAAALMAQEVVNQHGSTPPRGPESRPGQYIVTFKPGVTGQQRALAAIGSGAALHKDLSLINAVAVRNVSNSTLSSLRSNPLVANVVPDRILRASAKPGTPGGGGTMEFASRQVVSYEVQRVGVPTPASNGTGIGAAIVDSGLDLAHSDLAANISAVSYNAITPGDSCQDQAGHGTHIAGMLAAVNNNEGIVGVAPNAKLYCVKVLNERLEGVESDSIEALQWIYTNRDSVTPRIRVVNFSLGRPLAVGETQNSGPLFDAMQALYAAGVVVVVSAGNDPNIEVSSLAPAGFNNVITVGATVATGGMQLCPYFPTLTPLVADSAAGFTTDGAFVNGSGVSTSAPGEEREDIIPSSAGCTMLAYGTLSTRMGGGISRKLPLPALGTVEARGTSFAAPLVAGAVARILQLGKVAGGNNAAFVENVRNYIRNNADRRNAAPFDYTLAGYAYYYTFDNEREGIAQAPKQ